MEEYETWVDNSEDTEEVTMCKKNSQDKMLTPNAVLIAAYEAENYDEAMKKHHEIMGWEEYKPF